MAKRIEEQLNAILEWRIKMQNWLVGKQLQRERITLDEYKMRQYDQAQMYAQDKRTSEKINSEFLNPKANV